MRSFSSVETVSQTQRSIIFFASTYRNTDSFLLIKGKNSPNQKNSQGNTEASLIGNNNP